MSERATSAAYSRWWILWGILLIICGILAIGWPLFTAVAVSAIIAWLIVFAGCEHIIYAFHARSVGSAIWDVLVGLAYIAVGIYIVAHPLIGVATLTLLLAGLFFLEGALEVVAYFQLRHRRGSGWFLLDGIITLLLGGLILAHWPSSSRWVVGMLVGLSMIISGVTRVLMSLAWRRLATPTDIMTAIIR